MEKGAEKMEKNTSLPLLKEGFDLFGFVVFGGFLRLKGGSGTKI